MKFSRVCYLGVLATVLLTLLTEGCIKSNRKRLKPECPHGKNPATGTCKPGPITSNICKGDFSLNKKICRFFTAEYPNGCSVASLRTRNSSAHGCVVVDSENKHCTIDNFNRVTMLCTEAIARQKANVSVYLTVEQDGFKPHIVFDVGEKAKAGAILELEEQRYRGIDVSDTKLDDGSKVLSVNLKIPWRLNYTKEDGTGVCADGVLNGHHNSKTNASPGSICVDEVDYEVD